MNVSAACPQCGAIANPNDRFCNTCGNPLRPPAAAAPAGQPGAPAAQPPPPVAAPPPYPQPAPQPPYAGQPAYPQQPPQGYPPQPPTQQAAYAQPPGRPQRCQVGHEIMPGMSYCAQGHPIALDAMQFANDPNAPYAQQGQPPPQGYGAPPPGGGYAQQPQGQPYPSPGFGAALPYQAPPQQGYGGPPQGYPQPVFQPAAVPPQLYVPPPAPQAPPQGGYAPHEASPGAHGSKQLRGFVVSFQSNPSGDFWALSTGRTTVGRANAPEPADVPLADATISSRHAAFMIDLNVVVVEDTNSTNGTYVNEEHIGQNGKRELRDGDRVRFGGYTTLVKILGRP